MSTREPEQDLDAPTTPRSPAASRDTERDLEPPDTDETGPVDAPDATSTSATGGSTLLSAGAAALRDGESRDPRVDDLERQIEQLEARLKVLELARSEGVPSDRRWLLWVGVLLALALGWQLRAFFQ